MRRAKLTIKRYRDTRFWGLYESGVLLCVTVYKKGARAVQDRLERGTVETARPKSEPVPKRRRERGRLG